MSKTNNGGSVFPNNFSDRHEPEYGMTLRDYFAAKAMQGMLAERETILAFANTGRKGMVETSDLMATAAYGMADAMLEQREVK